MKQGQSFYLPVWKFILFSILSFGTYTIYWYYRTWKYLKNAKGEWLSPGLRTLGMTIPILNFFVSYQFLRRIDKDSSLYFSPRFLAILFGLASLLSFWIPLAGLLGFLPLCFAQNALNKREGGQILRWKRGEVLACTFLAIFLSDIPSAVVFGTRWFLISPFEVEGNAMIDTLADSEYIIINKFAFLVGDPVRGDVVVFHPPNDPSKYYVKRVIGQPGDTVTLRDGYVYLKIPGDAQAQKLDETSYLNSRNLGHTFRHPPSSGDGTAISYEIPPGEFFLLGDNRQGSLDSRSFTESDGKPMPFVAENDIKGRVWFVVLPINNIHVLKAPKYGLKKGS